MAELGIASSGNSEEGWAEDDDIEYEKGEGDPADDGQQSSTTINPAAPSASADFTLMPKVLDSQIEKHAPTSSLRSTIIKTTASWTRKRMANLLTSARTTSLASGDLKSEKDKAFDLLDALSRSGSLPIGCSELHVVISVTHCFDKGVMDTIVQDNINPIEQLEMSTLLVASTIHGVPARGLLKSGSSEVKRLVGAFPSLMNDTGGADGGSLVEAEGK